jgi:hypothetical protein
MEEWCTFIRHCSSMPFALMVGARPMAALVVVAKTLLQGRPIGWLLGSSKVKTRTPLQTKTSNTPQDRPAIYSCLKV